MHIFRDNVQLVMPGQVIGLSTIWKDLLGYAKKRSYHKKGSNLYWKDIGDNTFAYIKSGVTGTIQTLADGQECIKLFIGEGCLFHEVYVLAGFCNSFPLHRCMSSVELYHFDGTLLADADFIANHPSHMLNLSTSIAMKTVAQDMIREIIGHKTACSKIANWMLLAATVQKSRKFVPSLTQLELASMLHIHKSTVNRTILAIREAGIIGKFNRRICEIRDLQELKAIATGDRSL